MKIVFLIALCITLVPKSTAEGSVNSTNDNSEDDADVYDIHLLKQRSIDPGYKKAALQLIVVTACAVWIILLNIFFCYKYHKGKIALMDIERNTLHLKDDRSSCSENRSIVSLVNAESNDEPGISPEQQDSISSTGIQSTDSVCRTLRKGYSPLKGHSRGKSRRSRRKDGYVSLKAVCSDDEEEWCYKNAFTFTPFAENNESKQISLFENTKPESKISFRNRTRKISSRSLESFFDPSRTLTKLHPPEANRSLNAIQMESFIEREGTSEKAVSVEENMLINNHSAFKIKCRSAWKRVKKKLTPSSHSFRKKKGSYEMIPTWNS